MSEQPAAAESGDSPSIVTDSGDTPGTVSSPENIPATLMSSEKYYFGNIPFRDKPKDAPYGKFFGHSVDDHEQLKSAPEEHMTEQGINTITSSKAGKAKDKKNVKTIQARNIRISKTTHKKKQPPRASTGSLSQLKLPVKRMRPQSPVEIKANTPPITRATVRPQFDLEHSTGEVLLRDASTGSILGMDYFIISAFASEVFQESQRPWKEFSYQDVDFTQFKTYMTTTLGFNNRDKLLWHHIGEDGEKSQKIIQHEGDFQFAIAIQHQSYQARLVFIIEREESESSVD